MPLPVNAREETFTLQFFHKTRVHELFPVPLFFDLHELEKNRRIFRTWIRYFGKYFQPEILSLLENFAIRFAEIFSQHFGAEFAIGTKPRQPGDKALHEILHSFAL